MGFIEAIQTCFSKYGTFQGRALRSEFWYFYLFYLLALLFIWLLGIAFIAANSSAGIGVFVVIYMVFVFGTMVPFWAVTARRLHDTNRSGWWQVLPYILSLFSIIPALGIVFSVLSIVAAIVVIVWLIMAGEKKDNRFGKNIYKKIRKKKR
tara:strand:- start:102 stop:554 length:453 start_codon:yes stop_codon:yes gene_type:complete